MSSVAFEPLVRQRVERPFRQPLVPVGLRTATPIRVRVRPRWPWYAAASCFTLYLVVGIWLINVKGFTINDANARTVSAEIMVLSRDPHLGAMGFYWPPLPMLIRIPFVLLLHPFDQAILAGPASTALCAALVVPVLARIARLLGLSTGLSALLVGLYALNPITIFSGANAMSEAMFALVTACLLLGVLRVVHTRSVRDLAFVGIVLGVGVATRIEFIPITAVVVVGCVAVAEPALRRRTVAVVLAPPAFVFFLWSWASSLIAGDALFWYHAGKVAGSSVGFRPWLPPDLNPVTIVGYVGYMTLLLAPALAVAAGIGFSSAGRRLSTAVLALIAATVPAFVALQLQLGVSTGEPRYFVLMPLFQCVMCMWALRSVRHRSIRVRRLVAASLALLTAVGAVVATYAHADPVRTAITKDGAFYAEIVGHSPPEHSDFPATLGPIAAALDPHLARGKRVAMDSRGGTTILFSRYPGQFIVPEDRDFEQIMSDPTGRFDYAIIAGLFPSGATPLIKAAMAAVEGGHFEIIEKTTDAELWAFVPDAPTS